MDALNHRESKLLTTAGNGLLEVWSIKEIGSLDWRLTIRGALDRVKICKSRAETKREAQGFLKMVVKELGQSLK